MTKELPHIDWELVNRLTDQFRALRTDDLTLAEYSRSCTAIVEKIRDAGLTRAEMQSQLKGINYAAVRKVFRGIDEAVFWTKEYDKQVADYMRANPNMLNADIAKHFSIPTTAVRDRIMVFRNNGLLDGVPPRDPNRIPEGIRVAAYDLFDQGVSSKDVCAQLGISISRCKYLRSLYSEGRGTKELSTSPLRARIRRAMISGKSVRDIAAELKMDEVRVRATISSLRKEEAEAYARLSRHVNQVAKMSGKSRADVIFQLSLKNIA